MRRLYPTREYHSPLGATTKIKMTKKLITALLILLVYSNVNCQTSANINWEYNFGEEKNDGVNSIIKTQDGGFVVVGYSTDSSFNVNLCLIKLDENGNEEWKKFFGDDNELEMGIDLVQLNNSDFLVLGNCSSKIAKGKEIWLLHLNNEGELIQEKKFGKNADDIASQIITCNNSGFAILATSNSEITDNCSFWLFKINDSLELEWESFFGGDEFEAKYYQTVGGEKVRFVSREEAFALAQSKDNGFLLGGYQSDSQNVTNNWVIKTDSLGQEIWNKCYGTFGGDFVNGIYDLHPKVVAVGIRYDKKDDFNYMMDFAIIDKNEVVETTYNAEDYETVETSCQTEDSGFLLVGFKGENLSFAELENREPKRDVWLVKVDSEGKKLWEFTIKEKGINLLKSVIEIEKNVFILAGGKRDESTQLQDLWITKISIKNKE